MKIAYVTLYDPRDVTLASGTGYHILECLEARGIEMACLGPLKHQYHPVNIARHLAARYVERAVDHAHRDPGFLRHYARQVERKLEGLGADLVLGSGGLPLAYLETDLPIVLWTDCTFHGLLNYYGSYSNLSRRTIRNGHAADQSLFDRIAMAIFPSEWAMETAAEGYGFDRSKVVLIPRGANVPGLESDEALDALLAARPRERLRLLFIGVDWERKGGAIAVEAAAALNDRGVPTELVVVGCTPPLDPLPDFVTALGRIPKSTDEGLARIIDLYRSSHFFILPTRADAFGIVFGEAGAYGVPSLAPRTGGVPSALLDGVTGRLLDLADRGDAYADVIEPLWRDRSAYEALARSAYRDFRERTNWPAVGRRAHAAFERLLAGAPLATEPLQATAAS